MAASEKTAGPFLPFDAARYLAATGAHVDVARHVVLAFDAGVAPPRGLVERARSRLTTTNAGPFRAVRPLGSDVDLVVAGGPGPAVAAATVEMLATLGVERIVSVGVGAGTGGLIAGDLCVVVDTIDPSGLLPMPFAEPEPRAGRVFDALAAQATPVTAGTTSWPFRVPAEVVGAAVGDGRPLVIEMEVRALFAAADEAGVAADALLVISDRHSIDGWSLGDPNQTAAVLATAVDLARSVLESAT